METIDPAYLHIDTDTCPRKHLPEETRLNLSL